MYRYHLPSLPRALVSKRFSHCAFTQKILNLSLMMRAWGFDVIVYWTEWWLVDEVVLSKKDYERIYHNDHKKNFFEIDKEEGNQLFLKNCVKAIQKNRTGQDILLMPFWFWHYELKKMFPQMISIESGIGYHDSIQDFENHYKIFESYAEKNFHLWQVYAQKERNQMPSRFDTVIPNYYDLKDFPKKLSQKSDYFVFVGRGTISKWYREALDATHEIGSKLMLVWQNQQEIEAYIKEKGYTHATLLWVLDPKKRNDVMKKAIATICFTYYQEPFCWVKTESYLNFTPVISSDHWVFNEDVFSPIWVRCVSYQGIVQAMKKYKDMDHKEYRKVCLKARNFWENYSLENIRPYYRDFFLYIEEVYKTNWKDNTFIYHPFECPR